MYTTKKLEEEKVGAIKSWAALAAVTAVVSAVFVSLLPQGKMKNAFLALVGVVLLCALISPLSAKNKSGFDVFEDYSSMLKKNEESYQRKSEEVAVSVAEKGYENALRQSFLQNGIEARKIKVKCKSDCSAEKAEITLEEGTDEGKVRSLSEKVLKNAKVVIKRVEENEKQSS